MEEAREEEAKVPGRLTWVFHNCVGHPLMGLLQLFGLDGFADWVHDATLPRGAK